MKKKLKGKCRKCAGCNKIFEKGFIGVKKCKYYIKRTIFNSNLHTEEEEKELPFILLITFEIFVIIAFMFFIYKILILSVGG